MIWAIIMLIGEQKTTTQSLLGDERSLLLKERNYERKLLV